jgi:hypothetical protein
MVIVVVLLCLHFRSQIKQRMKKQLLATAFVLLAIYVLQAQDTIARDVFVTRNGFLLIPENYFPQISGRYFSFIATGQDLTAPLVNNIAIDVVDAKFTLAGAARLDKNYRFLLNASFTADKDGNVASLFSDYKSGGTFTGALDLSWRFRNKFIFSPESRYEVQPQIRAIEAAARNTQARIYRDILKSSDVTNYENLKELESIFAAGKKAEEAYNHYQMRGNIYVAMPVDTGGMLLVDSTKKLLLAQLALLKQVPGYSLYQDTVLRANLSNASKHDRDSLLKLYTVIYPDFISRFNNDRDKYATLQGITQTENNMLRFLKDVQKQEVLDEEFERNDTFANIFRLDEISRYANQQFVNELVKFNNKQYRVVLPAYNATTYKQVLENSINSLETRLGAYNFPYNAFDTLSAGVEKRKLAVYNAADWTAVRMNWFTLKQKIGGTTAYTFKPDTLLPSPARPDSTFGKGAKPSKQKALNYSVAIEYNFYYWNQKRAAVLVNLGLGAERWNNLYTFDDKRDITEQTTIKDSTFVPGRSSQYAKKYSAYVDEKGTGLTSDWGLLLYGNVYAMFGASKAFGAHVMFDYRNNFKKDDNKRERLGLSFGLVGNVPNKDGKSVVGVEAYIKFGDVTNKGLKYITGVEGQSEIGVTFNVPILSVPKAK